MKKNIDNQEKLISFLCFLIISCISYYFFQQKHLPLHDTRAVYEIFYIFYNSLINYHSIPLWLPQVEYGIPSDNLLVTYLSIPNILAKILGLTIKAKNTMNIFYLSVNLELIIYAWGAYLFGRVALINRAAAIYFSACLLLSTIYMWEIFFNLRMFLYLPWAAYFIFIGFDRLELKYLLLSLLCQCLSLIGNPPYFLFPLAFLYLSIFTAIYLDRKFQGNFKENITHLKKSFDNNKIICLGIISLNLILLATWISITIHMADNITIISSGRLKNGSVPFQDFLQYGYIPQFKILSELVNLLPSNIDAIIYSGISATVLFIYSLLNVKKNILIIFFITIIILICFLTADATIIPKLFYNLFPTANLYRHNGLLISAVQFFGLFCAALGLDRLIIKKNVKNLIFIMLLILGYYIWHTIDLSSTLKLNLSNIKSNKNFVYFQPMFFLCLILAIALCNQLFKKTKIKLLCYTIITTSILDLLLFNYAINHKVSISSYKKLYALDSPRLLSKNLWRESSYPLKYKEIIETYESRGANYSIRDAFIGNNFCTNLGRSDLVSKSIGELTLKSQHNEVFLEKHYWNKWMSKQKIPQINTSEPIKIMPDSLIGCERSSVKVLKNFNDYQRANNFYNPLSSGSNITFNYKKPISMQGIKITGINCKTPHAKLNIYTKTAEGHWKLLKSILIQQTSSNENFAWFENYNKYSAYKVQIHDAEKGLCGFKKIKLIKSQPIGFITTKIKTHTNINKYIKNTKKELISISSIESSTKLDEEHSADNIFYKYNNKFWASSSSTNFPQIISFKLNKPYIINELEILSSGSPLQTPANFKLYGSKDMQSWKNILSSSESKTPMSKKWGKYKLKNQKMFEFYKLIINSNFGDSDFTSLYGIKLHFKEGYKTFANILSPQQISNVNEHKSNLRQNNNHLVMLQRSYNSIKMHVESNDENSLLVWREAWSPEWIALVDGKKTDTQRVDVGFIGVLLSKGEHEVQLKYIGNSHFKQKYLTLIAAGLSAFFILILFSFRDKRHLSL